MPPRPPVVPSSPGRYGAGTSDDTCADGCATSFRSLGSQMEQLGGTLSVLSDKIGTLGERISSQETGTKSLWHEVRQLNDTVRGMTSEISQAIREHKEDCIGMQYARRKIEAASSRTPPGPVPSVASEITASFALPTEVARLRLEQERLAMVAQQLPGTGAERGDRSGVVIPKHILWAGMVVGVAVAAAIYVLSALNVL